MRGRSLLANLPATARRRAPARFWSAADVVLMDIRMRHRPHRDPAAGDMLFAPTVTRRLIEAYANRVAPQAVELPADLDCLTVKTHLNRAMAKPHLTSRAQAVVLAYATGLVALDR